MAKSVNKVFLLGNVGKDPEIKATGGGTIVANFGLATSERFKDQQGNFQERTEWHNVVAYGRVGEIVRDYVKKGNKLFIEGRINTRNWDDKEHPGRKVYRTEIIVNDLSLLSGREEGAGAAEDIAEGRARRRTSISVRRPAPTTSRSRPRSPTTIFRFKGSGQSTVNSDADRALRAPRLPWRIESSRNHRSAET